MSGPKHKHHLSMDFCDTPERDDASFMSHHFGGPASKRGFSNQQDELSSALRFAEANGWRASVGVDDVFPQPKPLQEEVSALKADLADMKGQHDTAMHDKDIENKTLRTVIADQRSGS